MELTDKPDKVFVPSPIKVSKLEEGAINKVILEFSKKRKMEPVVQSDPDHMNLYLTF